MADARQGERDGAAMRRVTLDGMNPAKNGNAPDPRTARGSRKAVKQRTFGGPFEEHKRALLEWFEREYFTELHAATGGNVSEMSRQSGLERSTARVNLTRHGLRWSEGSGVATSSKPL
jgi:hypothetical protein